MLEQTIYFLKSHYKRKLDNTCDWKASVQVGVWLPLIAWQRFSQWIIRNHLKCALSAKASWETL